MFTSRTRKIQESEAFYYLRSKVSFKIFSMFSYNRFLVIPEVTTFQVQGNLKLSTNEIKNFNQRSFWNC